MNGRILVVDDEPDVCAMLDSILSAEGHEVTRASGAVDALDVYRRLPFEVVIADVHLGERSGIEMLREIRQFNDEATVVVLTGDPSSQTATRALESGAYDYLVKPFASPDVIRAAVGRAMERVLLFDRNRDLLEHVRRNTELLETVNSKLSDIANRDPLTGLYNHRFLLEALALETARSRRHNRSCALILADVDDFRQYSESQGHLASDELLKTLAQILQTDCRSSTVNARFGGDEFALLAPEVPADGALIYAKKLGRLVSEHSFPGGRTQPLGKITLSIGLAVYPDAADDAPRLIECARRALARAKDEGPNSVSAWERA